MSAPGDLRQRLTRGIQAQSALQGLRLLVQVGSVALLAATWGAQLYGEWLILFALPAYLAVSDIGLFAAAGNDMVMRVARDDRDGAQTVFRAASIAVTLLFVAMALLVIALAILAPLRPWLNLDLISEASAAWLLFLFSFNSFLVAYGAIVYGGFTCVGRYGAGTFGLAGIALLEFCGLLVSVLLGAGPVVAAASMLAGRAVGTIAAYAVMRRQVRWLSLGRPAEFAPVLRPLIAPGLGSASFLGALALNVQGVVVLLGALLGPASVAVFSTVRTMSRSVIQIFGALMAVTIPELAKAFAEERPERLRRIHRSACQTIAWLAIPMLGVLAVFGDQIVELWTSDAIQAEATVLYLLLAVAGLDALWTTSFGVVYARNQHRRLSLTYLLASAGVLPLAFGLAHWQGIDGAALAILVLEIVMLAATLRQSLPASQDTLGGWLRSLVKPPPVGWLLRRVPPAT